MDFYGNLQKTLKLDTNDHPFLPLPRCDGPITPRLEDATCHNRRSRPTAAPR